METYKLIEKFYICTHYNYFHNKDLLLGYVNVKLQLSGSFPYLLIDFSLTVKAATLIFISGCGSAISSAKQGISGSIYNFVKN